MAAVATLPLPVLSMPAIGMSQFALFVPSETGEHLVEWDGTNSVTFSAPFELLTPSSANVQCTVGQLVTMTVLLNASKTFSNVRVSFESIPPVNMDQIGGAPFTMVRNWDFGTSGNITNFTQLEAQFEYFIPEWNTYNLGGQYGTNTVARTAETALVGQPVDGSTRYREFTTSSILCHVKSLVNDTTDVGPASSYNGGNGSFYSKLDYPSGGSDLGKTIVWETRMRIQNPTAGQWLALWTAGTLWDIGPEMDVIEGFSLFDPNEAWHSNVVQPDAVEDIDYWSGNWWDGQIEAGIISPANQLADWHTITWVYHSNNTFEVYFDDYIAQSGTFPWRVGEGGSDNLPTDMRFLFDFGALHTSVGGYDTHVIPFADLPITYEIDYSRVWERTGV